MGAAWDYLYFKKTLLATSNTMVVFSDKRWGLVNVINNSGDNNNNDVYILSSVRSEMGYTSVTLTIKD